MFYDVTLPIYPGMPVFPGDPEMSADPVLKISAGDGINLHRISLGTHTGTHIDVPFHISEHGFSVDHINLEVLIGSAFVLDLGEVKEICHNMLANYNLGGIRRLIIKTGYSYQDRTLPPENYPYLTKDAAKHLVRLGIQLVGIDSPSVDPVTGELVAHRELLGSSVIIVENLNLARTGTGEYQLICMPLLLAGMDGAPARVLLSQKISCEIKEKSE